MSFLIAWSIKLAFVFAAAAGAGWFARRQSAAFRHLLWATAILCGVLLPVVTRVMPYWMPPGLPPLLVTAASSRAATPGTDGAGDSFTAASLPSHPRSGPPSRFLFADLVASVWIAVCSAFVFRLAAGGFRLAWLASRSCVVDDVRWQRIMKDLAGQLRIRRPVRLLESVHGSILVTWGGVHPTILLPPGVETWSEERIRVVLGHELAHIQRMDWIVFMAAEVLRAIHWFNPLAWIACSRLRDESEHACDDIVLSLGTSPTDYASHLLELARIMKSPHRTWAVALAMAHQTLLERRIITMLNPSINRLRRTPARLVPVAVLAALVLVLPLAAFRAPEAGIRIELPMPQAFAAMAPEPVRAIAEVKPVPSAARPTQVPVPVLLPRFTGTVYDPSGALVPGVMVAMTNAATGVREEVTANAVGVFEFSTLQGGRYSLEASLPGFKNYQRPITLQPGANPHHLLTMSMGTVTEKLEVQTQGTPATVVSRPPRRVPVGGNVSAATLIRNVHPLYPTTLKDLGIEGTVLLEGLIATDGKLRNLRVLNGDVDPEFAQAALDAASQWVYRPSRLNGQPFEITTSIEVEFRLVN